MLKEWIYVIYSESLPFINFPAISNTESCTPKASFNLTSRRSNAEVYAKRFYNKTGHS